MSEDISAEVSRLRSRYDRLRRDGTLADETREMGDTATTVAGLPGTIEQLRGRGYAFAGYLTSRAQQLQTQWAEVRGRVEAQIRQESDHLRSEIGQLDAMMSKLDPANAKLVGSVIARVEPVIDRLENDLKAAQERIAGVYGSVAKDAAEIKKQLGKFNWYMDMAGEADFEFNATEAVYIVAKGEWVKTGKGKQDPDGLFYLTDQRFIFERKEKEGGFLGFGGKKVQGIEWEVPLSAIANVSSEKKGLFGGKDMVYLTISGGGPAPEVTIEVKGDVKANWYAQQLQRAIAGEIDHERALEPDPEVVEAVRNAPTACPNCGAPFSTPITRGMTQIACEYCGTVTRI
ncbi:MAG: hypothetical protein JW910_04895 [Anaerolineae bacterium]|nr:hypothetical protein [Anaerolineae bacterium]